MTVPHFEQVDLSHVKAVFTPDGKHRSQLKIPLLLRDGGRTLCIVGQNPSQANAEVADKTVRYLERFVFERMPDFGQILMLNLYSRVDTKKEQTKDLNSQDCEGVLLEAIRSNNDFLMVFGKLENKGAYRFSDRVNQLRFLFRSKNIYKLDIGTVYAPHPGNRKIHYSNFDLKIANYDFADIPQTET